MRSEGNKLEDKSGFVLGEVSLSPLKHIVKQLAGEAKRGKPLCHANPKADARPENVNKFHVRDPTKLYCYYKKIYLLGSRI